MTNKPDPDDDPLYDLATDPIFELSCEFKRRTAAVTQAYIASRLSRMGFEVHTEARVLDRGDGRPGRIDIVASTTRPDGTDYTIAIEIDRNKPRAKSIWKLNFYKCDLRIIILRNGWDMPPPAGIDKVMGMLGDPIDNADLAGVTYVPNTIPPAPAQ